MLQAKLKHNKKLIFSCTAAILFLLLALLAYNHFKPAPTYPLGDVNKLEYVGNTGYGCWLVCDANPAEVYYYATDMSVEEVVGYFKKTQLTKPPRVLDGISDFSLDKGGEDISIHFYLDKEKLPDKKYFQTSKKHILTIPSFDYIVAKDSL